MFGTEIDKFVKNNKLKFMGYDKTCKKTKKALLFQENEMTKIGASLVYIYGTNKPQYELRGYRLFQSTRGVIRHNTKTDFLGAVMYNKRKKINLKLEAWELNGHEPLFLLK